MEKVQEPLPKSACDALREAASPSGRKKVIGVKDNEPLIFDAFRVAVSDMKLA